MVLRVKVEEIIKDAQVAGVEPASLMDQKIFPTNLLILTVRDDRHGMTAEQFKGRWTQLGNDRIKHQSGSVEFSPHCKAAPPSLLPQWLGPAWIAVLRRRSIDASPDHWSDPSSHHLWLRNAQNLCGVESPAPAPGFAPATLNGESRA